jgi:uncharacterized membrane protein YeaQ/YmgE (transglycosylase-associated protein family)
VWIVLGLLAGFIASKIVNKQGQGALLDTVLGVVGAVVGGWLFAIFGAGQVKSAVDHKKHFLFTQKTEKVIKIN